jgi:hypothetical protein
VTTGSVDAVLPDAATLVDEMSRALDGGPPRGLTGLGGLVAELTTINLGQWDLEDSTRDAQASDAAVAGAKRAIDRLNLNRHRLVHEIDVAISGLVDPPATATLATESPGMVLDRLSVLVIRRSRTATAASRELVYADRLPGLDAQLGALVMALDTYLGELRAGARRFFAHDPLKLYLGRVDGTHEGGSRPG